MHQQSTQAHKALTVPPPAIRPAGHLSLGEVGKRLRLSPEGAERLVRSRTGLTGRWSRGVLLVRESDLAAFIASRRRW